MAACPPLEDLAAFIDGMLPPEERARITEHLARCESCYEVFSGAVDFLEEEKASSANDTGGGGVLPFPLAQEKNQEAQETKVWIEPARPLRRSSRWLPLAAAVVLTAGLGYMLWQRSQVLPEVRVAGVVEPLQGKEGVGDAVYQVDTVRGHEENALPFSSALPFLAGVYLVDLRLSDPAGEERPTEAVLGSVAGVLEEMMFVSPGIVTFFKNQSQQADLQVLARELPKQESALEKELAEEPLFRFGLWTEAGRVSAKVRSQAFFDERRNRRFLTLIPREVSPEQDPRYQPILDSLQKIEPLWDHSPRDYEALALHLENIVDQFYRIQQEDQEDLGLPLDSGESLP